MTVTAQVARTVTLAAPGATLFPFGFKISAAADLLVTVNGVVKILTADYSVAGVGVNAGGSIVFVVPMVGSERVILKRNMAYERVTDFQDQGDLLARTLNNDQDAPVLMCQQLAAAIALAVRFPDDSAASGLLPTIAPLSSIRMNAAGTAFEAYTPTPYALPSGSDQIGFNFPGIGAATLTLLQQGREQIPTVAAYSSAGVIDAAAFTRAFAAHNAIRVPAGLYLVAGDIICNGKPLTIIGDGIGVTEIRFTGNGGIKFNGGAMTAFGPNLLNVIGLTITTSVANTQPAIQAVWSGGTGNPPKGGTFRDIDIRAISETQCFAKGIDLFNARDTIFHNVSTSGRHKLAGTYGMAVGVDIRGDSDPVEFWFTQCYIYWCDIGVQATTNCEGIYVQNSSLSFNEIGVKYYATGTVEPVLHCQGCYFNGTARMIDIKNVAYVNMNGCGFSSDNMNATSDWIGVRYEQTSGYLGLLAITDCYFAGTGYTGGFLEYGIQLYNAQLPVISNFRAYNLDVGMYFDANCVNVKLRDPVITATPVAITSDGDSIEYATRQGPGSSYLTNGGFDVWQRGASFASAAAGVYTADRWTFYRAGFALGATASRQTAVYPSFSEFSMRLQRDNTNASVAQITAGHALESNDSKKLRGRDVVLSFVVRAGANFSGGTYAVRIFSGTGTDQPALGAGLTGEVTVTSAAFTPTAAFHRVFLVCTPGQSITQLAFEFRYTPTGVAGVNDWLEFADVKLEAGSFPSAYEGRGFADELAQCQRFYEKSYDYSVAVATNTVVGAEMLAPYTPSNDFSRYKIPFKVQKRSTPIVSLYASDGTADRVDVIDTALKTTVATLAASPALTGFRGWVATTTGNSPGVSRTGFHWVANAEF